EGPRSGSHRRAASAVYQFLPCPDLFARGPRRQKASSTAATTACARKAKVVRRAATAASWNGKGAVGKQLVEQSHPDRMSRANPTDATFLPRRIPAFSERFTARPPRTGNAWHLRALPSARIRRAHGHAESAAPGRTRRVRTLRFAPRPARAAENRTSRRRPARTDDRSARPPAVVGRSRPAGARRHAVAAGGMVRNVQAFRAGWPRTGSVAGSRGRNDRQAQARFAGFGPGIATARATTGSRRRTAHGSAPTRPGPAADARAAEDEGFGRTRAAAGVGNDAVEIGKVGARAPGPPDRYPAPETACRIRSLARSPIMIAVALVLPCGMVGMIEASASHRPSGPRTRQSGPATAIGSSVAPIFAVPTG